MSESVRLIAVTPINHDGVDYPPGTELSVTPAQAQPLLDCGAATEAPPAEADAAPAKAKK